MGRLFNDAISFAVRKHAGQLRKGTKIPYIVHPMEAAAIVATITNDEVLLSAAVLHDTVEDTDTPLEEIVRLFGPRVAALVAEESENKREESPADATWIIRKKEAIERLKGATHEVKLIALGDKLSNIRAICRDYEALGDSLWNRFNQKDPAMQGWYYESIGDIFEADAKLCSTAACREYREKVNRIFHHTAFPGKDAEGK